MCVHTCVCTHASSSTTQSVQQIATKMLPREEAIVNQAQCLLSEFSINSKSKRQKSPSPCERLATGPVLQGLVTREAFHGAKGPGRQSSAYSLQMAVGRAEGVSCPLTSFGSRPCDCFNQQNRAKYCSMTSEARQITTISHPLPCSLGPVILGTQPP